MPLPAKPILALAGFDPMPQPPQAQLRLPTGFTQPDCVYVTLAMTRHDEEATRAAFERTAAIVNAYQQRVHDLLIRMLQLFGADGDSVELWLRSPNTFFDGRSPAELIDSGELAKVEAQWPDGKFATGDVVETTMETYGDTTTVVPKGTRGRVLSVNGDHAYVMLVPSRTLEFRAVELRLISRDA